MSIRTNDHRIQELADTCINKGNIDKDLYSKYNVISTLR